MKIINGGKKDYYDYLVSKYGIDDDIVYDRRNSIVLKEYDLPFYFQPKNRYDKRRELKRFYTCDDSRKYHIEKKYIGTCYYFILEVGFKDYLFQIERYLDDNDELVIVPSLVKEIKSIKLSEEPISITPCDVNAFCDRFNLRTHQQILNPILSSIFIPSFIDAEEIYLNVYNYLIAIKDKQIIDNRNDIQKLESFGFDKKTSFRNPIYSANSKKKHKNEKI